MSTSRSSAPARRFLRHGMLPQLAAFEAVVRLGSATRAADALCIAQPTLSGHLRKLSEALGVQLFEQRGKRLEPTAAALLLLQTTDEVFDALDACERRLAALRAASASAAGDGASRRDHFDAPPACERLTALRMPRISASGGGGQPGTSTSTGITLATRPQLA
jgi:DNA-binding transcriptional LysR family regulator